MKNKTEAREPLVGYMIIEDYTDDYSDWSGQIAFPNPKGANIAWLNPIEMIEKSYADQREAELIGLLKEAAQIITNLDNDQDFWTSSEFREKLAALGVKND